MAVGRRAKLTMIILARIFFLHKYDPNIFGFKKNHQKNLIGPYLAGRQPCV